jgi:homoserine kinase type II
MGIYSSIKLHEINDILKFYGLGKASELESTLKGISNSNYIVQLEDGEQVLLKISNDKTIQQLEKEQTILHLLNRYQFPLSPRPFKTLQGKPIYQHNGFYGVIFPFIDGKAPIVSSTVVYQLGQALGQLHSLEISKEDLQFIRPYEHVGHNVFHIQKYVKSPIAPDDFVKTYNMLAHKIFPRGLNEIPFDLFPSGIIHGDLYYDNSLFKNDQLVSLIDFEQSGIGRYLLDLGISISGSCLNKEKDNIDMMLFTSFIKGYEEYRKMLTIEKDYIHTAIIVGLLSISLWRIKRFYEGKLDKNKKNNYQELLIRAQNFFESTGLN